MERLGPESYRARCRQDLDQARRLLTQLEDFGGEATEASILEPLNEVWIILDRSLGNAQLLQNVHPDSELRNIADANEQEISRLATDVGLSAPLFEAVSHLRTTELDEASQRYVRILLRDFRRSGVDKPAPTRQRIRDLRDQLVVLSQRFGTHIRDDVRQITLQSIDEMAGLPADYVAAHPPGVDGRVTLTTNYPDITPFMMYAKDDNRRLEYYREYRRRGHPDNEAVLREILDKRHELAELLGYPTWADYATEDKMIKTSAAAGQFIDRVAELAEPSARRDYERLLSQSRTTDPNAERVGDWQKTFLEHQLKCEQLDFDAAVVRTYFPFAQVRAGVLATTARLFGLSYRLVDEPVWHPSVECLDVLDGEQCVGRIYLDLHPREGKYKHAAAFPLQSGVVNRQRPEVALVANFPGGAANDPGLMEHSDVETFFHEMGHLLHHLLGGRQRWVQTSGFNVEWDFVEVPSQVLEEWAWDAEVLASFAHDARGQVIPPSLVESMNRARNFGNGLSARHQMFYAAFSLFLHQSPPGAAQPVELLRDLQARYSPFAFVPDTHFHLSFGHLDNYSALYYTYMWSLVIAKDMLEVFSEQGLLNPEPARHYRRAVLEPGGSVDAEVMVREFLGRDFDFDGFARWLARDPLKGRPSVT